MPESPYRREDITFLLIGLLAFYNAFLNILGPLMPYLRDELGLSYTVGSLHFSAIAAGMIAGGWVGDRVVRRIGRRYAAWTGAFGMCLGALGLTAGRNPVETILAVFLLMGCVGSLVLMVVGSSLSDHHGENRVLALSEANIAAAAGAGLAPLAIGAAVALGFGWRWAYLVPIAWLCLLAWRYRGVAFPPIAQLDDTSIPSLSLPKPFWILWTTVTLVVGVEFGLIYFGADFLDKVAGLSKDAAATTMSFFLWGMLVGRIVGRRVLGLAGAHAVLSIAIGIAGIGFATMWAQPGPIVSVVGLFVAGIGVANLYPVLLSLALEAAPGQSNVASARLSFASGSAILVAPLMLGGMSDLAGLRAGTLVVPVLLIAAIAVTQVGRGFSSNLADQNFESQNESISM